MSTGLTVDPDQEWWTAQQEAALAQIGIADAPKAEQAVFLHQCQRTGLDPFARQIYLIGRAGRYTIQTGIDGYRLVARRAVDQSGETLGNGPQEWCGEDGVWRDVWLADTPPAAARFTVIRNGQTFQSVALLHEYAALKRDGTMTEMWRTKPALMLSKCAEALAIRRAFPADLSGIYTTDEMQQANNPAGRPKHTPPPAVGTARPAAARAEAQNQIATLMGRLDLSRDQAMAFAERLLSRELADSNALNDDDWVQLAEALADWDRTGEDPTLVDVETGEIVEDPETDSEAGALL